MAVSAEEKLIVLAFKEWCRKNMPPKCRPIGTDAMTFFLSIGADGRDWDKVLRVLKKRGLVK